VCAKGDIRTVHVHVVTARSEEWGNLLVRDRLRRDQHLRATYERVKMDLAARFPHDRPGYTAAKRAFFERNLMAGAD
jgi:GrpB-like predicted nucleotidyltransferase (UPF0157 family)